MEALHEAPRQIIHGVVDASDIGSSRSKGETLWHMTFRLAAWSMPDGIIHRNKLLVRRDISEGQLDSYRDVLPVHGIVALEVGLVEESDFDGPQALLHEVLQAPSKREDLCRVAEELSKPVTVDDAQLGTFTLDRRVNWYEAQTTWCAVPVRLALSSFRDDEIFPKDTLACAKELWKNQKRWDREVGEYMVKELLGLKNEGWLQEGEASLNADEFLRRVSIETIQINPPGDFDFWYDDGDLFWGHSITVSGSLDEGINDAGIQG